MFFKEIDILPVDAIDGFAEGVPDVCDGVCDSFVQTDADDVAFSSSSRIISRMSVAEYFDFPTKSVHFIKSTREHKYTYL